MTGKVNGKKGLSKNIKQTKSGKAGCYEKEFKNGNRKKAPKLKAVFRTTNDKRFQITKIMQTF